MSAVTFDLRLEPSAGGEQTWRVTADITREHGRYFADLTGAHPEDAREYPSLYDVSDLEKALADDGTRTLDDVKQAAIGAGADQCESQNDSRDTEWEFAHQGDDP